MNLLAIIQKFRQEYATKTPKRTQIIDVFLMFQLMTGAVLFAYCVVVGTFPFNSFLSSFFACIGSFILTVCIRLQATPGSVFKNISIEQAYADYALCMILLFLVALNFMG